MTAMKIPAAARRLGLQPSYLRRHMAALMSIGLQANQPGARRHWRIDADSVELVKARMEGTTPVRQILLGEVL